MDKRLLIISNNVLSKTKNNGKTIYSYIDILPPSAVAQLYFNAELPSISGYRYFQITDMDVVKGIFCSEKRGRIVRCSEADEVLITGSKHGVNNAMRILREIVWHRRWMSKQLYEWLDEIKPTSIFFVGGDSAFAYDICEFIKNRYNTNLTLYITDDYIVPRKYDGIFGIIRRKHIKKKIKRILKITNCFYTMSISMRDAYKEIFGVESQMIVNLTESLKTEADNANNDIDRQVLVYTGSLYYGRDMMLGHIAKAIKKYNDSGLKQKAILMVYTNIELSETERNVFEIVGSCEYGGTLNPSELKEELNAADVLVFVESFDEEQVEKTKYSLSTKVPEYMSVGKPILAVGPEGIGSIEYLKDISMYVSSIQEIDASIEKLLDSPETKEQYAKKALEKYELLHNKKKIQRDFIENVFK